MPAVTKLQQHCSQERASTSAHNNTGGLSLLVYAQNGGPTPDLKERVRSETRDRNKSEVLHRKQEGKS